MIDLMFPQYQGVREWWSRAFAGLVWNQWKLLDAQYAAGIEALDAVTGHPAGRPGDERAGVETLEQYAAERVRKGLPPPRAVYEAQNRARIDWSQFPEWARPVDPEAFEGSSHEG
jgi:hypothetical protein